MPLLYDDYYNSNESVVIIEQDEVQITRLLGPDGKPFAIRRPKIKLGFDLSRKKVNEHS